MGGRQQQQQSHPGNPSNSGYQNNASASGGGGQNYENIDINNGAGGVNGAGGASGGGLMGPGGRRQVTILGRQVDYDLLVCKGFYFFFYAAFGSLFPLIAVYFKQLGMNATQAGFLIGIRPFIEYAASPFWASFANRFKKGKILLLFNLLCMILFTLSLSWVQPGTPFCLAHKNNQFFLQAPNNREKRSITMASFASDDHHQFIPNVLEHSERFKRQTGNEKGYATADFVRAPSNAHHHGTPGIAPEFLDPKIVKGYDPEVSGTLVRPPYSTRVYRQSGVEEVFLLMLLLVILGEFFSAPAISLVDSATLSLLEEAPELYGKQRLFGSVGWGLAMFFVGIALDNNTAFPNHPCGELEVSEKNYTMCFAVFSVLMACAMIASTQFNLAQDSRPDEVSQKIMDVQTRNVAPEIAETAKARAPEPVNLENINGPKWFGVLRTFGSPHYAAFLAVTWWMGFGVGLVFSFLFWHLQDLGGSPSLFGIASVINHVSEVAAYFFSFKLINKIGHVKVFYVGLIANSFRFLYVSWLSNPYWVLPFEFVQGISHAAVWAAATSYISLAAPAEQKASAQAILQSLHHGLGKGCGALIGGIVITYKGTRTMFVSYALLCLIFFLMFYVVNRFFKPMPLGQVQDDKLDGTSTLAPHGVPAVDVKLDASKFQNQSQYQGQYQNSQPDPRQDAYDRYVAGGGQYEKPVTFDALPAVAPR